MRQSHVPVVVLTTGLVLLAALRLAAQMPDLPPDARIAGAARHRAIGVVYHPEYEQFGNYVPTVLPRRYDALLYLDRTRALHPLHLKVEHEEVPETYPSGV